MGYYDYECQKCKTNWEGIFFHMADIGTKKVKCPSCGSTRMQQDIGNKNITLDTDATFPPFYSVHTERVMNRTSYKRWKKMKEAQGYVVGELPSGTFGARKDPGQRMSDRVARFGPKAAQEHRQEYQKKNLVPGEKHLTPNQAAAIEARRRKSGRGTD